MCLAWHKYYLMCNYSVALYIYIYFKVFQLEDLTCYLIPILLDIYIMSREKKKQKTNSLTPFCKRRGVTLDQEAHCSIWDRCLR
jgi:hypothetical protein